MPLNNGELIKKIETLVEDEEITQRAAVILNLEATGRVVGDVGEIKDSVSDIQNCIKELTTVWKDNPSLIWLLRYKTKGTVAVLFSVLLAVVALSYLVVTSEIFREFMINQFSLPIK